MLGEAPAASALASRRASCIAIFSATLLASMPAHADSTLLFWAPRALEAVGATTFDEHGAPVGKSSFEVETDENGVRRMHVTMAIEGGGSNVSQATFAPVSEDADAPGRARGARPETEPDNTPETSETAKTLEASATSSTTDKPNAAQATGPGEASHVDQVALRLIEQRSQATTADGVVYPLLVIDHQHGRVSCYAGTDESGPAQHVDIPGEDRVVNVPMQLLFMPLVRGEVDTLRFQIAMCKPEPTVYQMIAVRDDPIVHDGREIIQIEYGPDLGKAVAWLASRLLPSFSFWFDAKSGEYLGHRMPLHREGPEVLLVRSGLTPTDLGAE